MEELARQLKMDPLEIRKINYLEKGEALATGQILDHAVVLRETTEKAYQALGERSPGKSNLKIGQVSLPE
jgi:CO/xanthine dehydrogenase Mo-binding subunit